MYYLILPIINILAPPSHNYPVVPLHSRVPSWPTLCFSVLYQRLPLNVFSFFKNQTHEDFCLKLAHINYLNNLTIINIISYTYKLLIFIKKNCNGILYVYACTYFTFYVLCEGEEPVQGVHGRRLRPVGGQPPGRDTPGHGQALLVLLRTKLRY